MRDAIKSLKYLVMQLAGQEILGFKIFIADGDERLTNPINIFSSNTHLTLTVKSNFLTNIHVRVIELGEMCPITDRRILHN